MNPQILRSFRLLSAVLALACAASSWAAPQDTWSHVGPDIAQPSGVSFTGPLAVSGDLLFAGLSNGSFARLKGFAIIPAQIRRGA